MLSPSSSVPPVSSPSVLPSLHCSCVLSLTWLSVCCPSAAPCALLLSCPCLLSSSRLLLLLLLTPLLGCWQQMPGISASVSIKSSEIEIGQMPSPVRLLSIRLAARRYTENTGKALHLLLQPHHSPATPLLCLWIAQRSQRCLRPVSAPLSTPYASSAVTCRHEAGRCSQQRSIRVRSACQRRFRVPARQSGLRGRTGAGGRRKAP